MSMKTALHALHLEAGAKMVDFGGWDMPLHYGSQVEEHHQVRKACGLFDVSHMTIMDVEGEQAKDYLSVLIANDVATLTSPGQALYTCMLNQQGGVVDDLIVYWRGANHYRLVVNASTRDKDMAWMQNCAKPFQVSLIEQPEYAMLAVQGPAARKVFAAVAEKHNLASLWAKAEALKPFTASEHNAVFVGRTGYTGEDGFEILMPQEYAGDTWKAFVGLGATPCGLGCRDTLRIEAGLNLYGTDMDETVTPLESGLAWTVDFSQPERAFIGRAALESQRQSGGLRKFKGLILDGKGVIRGAQKVTTTDGAEGIVTSGTFSPTLNRSVGFVRITDTEQTACEVEIRGRPFAARLSTRTFVRNGTIRVKI